MNKSERMAQLARSIGASAESIKAVKKETQKAVKTDREPRRSTAQLSVEKPAVKRAPARLKQMTVKLSPEIRGRLLQESARRKDADAENWPIQTIITEALQNYLGGK